MNAEPTYLHGYGSRKHIADGDAPRPRRGDLPALCGSYGSTTSDMERSERLWAEAGADDRIRRVHARPLCKRCQAAADRLAASSPSGEVAS